MEAPNEQVQHEPLSIAFLGQHVSHGVHQPDRRRIESQLRTKLAIVDPRMLDEEAPRAEGGALPQRVDDVLCVRVHLSGALEYLLMGMSPTP